MRASIDFNIDEVAFITIILGMAEFATEVPPFSIPQFLGGVVMCICMGLILYGVTLTQTYIYVLNCKEDPLWLKALVATLWIVETVHTAAILRQMYYSTILAFGSRVALLKVDW
ncbi:hypothetical protein QCA50_002623 [Cerrena zonata]|uniref:Uncharacterized protein n=1 Tax=Cerrena zonata TaxID=2478898 RepID=A0AAW0GHE3_9APHY